VQLRSKQFPTSEYLHRQPNRKLAHLLGSLVTKQVRPDKRCHKKCILKGESGNNFSER